MPPQAPYPAAGGPFTPGSTRKGASKGVIVGVSVAVVALLAICGSVGVAGFLLYRAADEASDTAKPVADQPITGLIDYRKTDPASLTRNHKTGQIPYKVSPPAGGDHNGTWQNCEGDVYDAEIPDEQAVHSLEHGAVWVTYRPDLPKDQVDALAAKVRGKDFSLMSPYPGLDKPISLQAWGYQLKVDSADDKDIDRFIARYRKTAAPEPGATCGTGETSTGTEPR